MDTFREAVATFVVVLALFALAHLPIYRRLRRDRRSRAALRRYVESNEARIARSRSVR